MDLSKNGLTALPDGIFDGLTSLEEMDLSDNKFTSIESGTLGDLVSLNILYVSPCTPDDIIDSSSTYTIFDVNFRGMDRLDRSYSCPTNPTPSKSGSPESYTYRSTVTIIAFAVCIMANLLV